MKKLLKYGVASLSLATLGVVATATNLPVLGAQVVHAEDSPIVEKGYGALFYIDEGNGPYFAASKRMSAPPVAENYYGDFNNITNITVELDPEYTAKINAERPDKDWEWYKVIYYISSSAIPKDTNTDPANGGNADTGGGNNADGDTQTPPVDDNGGETGSQDQTPPADNTGSTDTTTPPADAPKPQTLTVVETRQDENGEVIFTKTHSLVLNPGEEKDLGYNPDREVLVRGGNLYRYGNFEDGATLYFTTRLKPVTTPTSPATPPSAEELAQLADRLEALRQEVVVLDKTIDTGHESWIGSRLELVLKNVKAGDLLTYGSYDFVNIEKDLTERLATLKANQTSAPSVSTPASADQLATTRNKLLAQLDQSRLTDAQKGELTVKIAFAETAEELEKLKVELTSLTATANKLASAAKPATADQPASSTTKTLPATGELSTEALTAMGLALVLFSLGLAKTRKTN